MFRDIDEKLLRTKIKKIQKFNRTLSNNLINKQRSKKIHFQFHNPHNIKNIRINDKMLFTLPTLENIILIS